MGWEESFLLFVGQGLRAVSFCRQGHCDRHVHTWGDAGDLARHAWGLASLSGGLASDQGRTPAPVVARPLTWVGVAAPGPRSSSCRSRSPPSHLGSPGRGARAVLRGHGGRLSSAGRHKRDRASLATSLLDRPGAGPPSGRPVNLYTLTWAGCGSAQAPPLRNLALLDAVLVTPTTATGAPGRALCSLTPSSPEN